MYSLLCFWQYVLRNVVPYDPVGECGEWVHSQVRVLQPEGNGRGNWLPVSVSHSFGTSSVGGLIPAEEKHSCSFQEREKVYGRKVVGNRVEPGITCLYVITKCLPIGNIYVLSAFSFNPRQRSEALTERDLRFPPTRKPKFYLSFYFHVPSIFHSLFPCFRVFESKASMTAGNMHILFTIYLQILIQMNKI